MTREQLKESVETICDSIETIDEMRGELRNRRFLANLVGDQDEADHLSSEMFRLDLAEKRNRERLDQLSLA